jgi:hypothetical protein
MVEGFADIERRGDAGNPCIVGNGDVGTKENPEKEENKKTAMEEKQRCGNGN